MTHVILSINQVTVKSTHNNLFTNLNFTVSKGQHWALVGESGSGKSALLQTIAGRFNITGGQITYPFLEDYKLKHQITGPNFTPQHVTAFVGATHHFKNLSNTSNFYYQQRFNSFDSEDAQTVSQYLKTIEQQYPKQNLGWDYERVINRLNLFELEDEQIIKLSNGETKRLRLAAALLKNPVVLLLDNPLNGLDVQRRIDFTLLLDEIIDSGTTIILATTPDEIPDCITHVAHLEHGEIIKQIKKEDFLAITQSAKKEKLNTVDLDELKSLLNIEVEKIAYRHIIKMNQIHIQYGNKTILNKINLEVRQGERWALLGPNGAGKSTLLSLVNGDNPQAYANDIVLFDKKRGSGESIWDIKSKIGFVSPELHQYFPTENNCLQVIESGYYDTLGLFRVSSKKQRANALQWMKTLAIEKYATNLFKNIPASAQRLCLLARALVKNPDLLIFDEPCQGLDVQQQEHFKTIIDAICALTKVTMVYVTHYQHEIPDCVSKVIRLQDGQCVHNGEFIKG